MDNKDLLDVFGQISDEHIESAAKPPVKPAGKRTVWRTVIAAAAVVTLAVAAVPIVNGILSKTPKAVPMPDPVSSDAAPVSSTPGDDPVSAYIPPVSSETQSESDPAPDNTSTDRVSSDVPPVSSEPTESRPVSSESVNSEPESYEPVSSEPSSNEPVSTDDQSGETVSLPPEKLDDGDPSEEPSDELPEQIHIPLEQPPYSRTYHFDTYGELNDALKGGNSQLHREYEDDLGRTYKALIDGISDNSIKLKIPVFSGSPANINGTADWQNITMFSNELYNLPWVWYCCDYNGRCIVVGISYLDCLRVYGTDIPKSVGDLLDAVSPNSPRPRNKNLYSAAYDDITSERLDLQNGSVGAYIYKFKSGRTHYRFVYDGCLFSVWDYSGGEIGNDFWNGFSVENYN